MSRILILFATLVCSSLSYPIVRTWTLKELSDALELQQCPEQKEYLEAALNKIMYALYTGNEKDVLGVLISPTGEKRWTMEQLKKARGDPDTNPIHEPFISNALQYLLNMEGTNNDTAEVVIPALDISVWTSDDVEEAKNNNKTLAALLPYLKEAEEIIQNAIGAGVDKDAATATIVTPVGLILPENLKNLVIVARENSNEIPKLV